MALSLIWREALPLGTLPPLQVPTEDLILAATEFVSRSVALSGKSRLVWLNVESG